MTKLSLKEKGAIPGLGQSAPADQCVESEFMTVVSFSIRKLQHFFFFHLIVETMLTVTYEKKQEVKLQARIVTAVSLTSDMWTSINVDAWLAVRRHHTALIW